MEELPTHGGSLRLWLAPEAAGRQPTSSVADVRAKEQAAALESLEAWADFQCRAQAAKNSLLRFLLSEREAGRSVLGYGAAAKGNTLINYAGLRSDLLAAVADRASSKQGRYLPGSHIPVISPQQLAQRDPHTLLVLPWNLIEEVAQQWPGRRLATAIPELRLRG